MFTWPWWLFSLSAAVVWGLHFNMVVKVSNALPKDVYTPLTLFAVTALPIFFLMPFMYQKIGANIITLWQADNEVRVSLLVLMCTTLVAACLLYIAMQLSPNATIAALLDITYPLFIALIAWLLYRQNHLDWTVLLGGALIFAGAMLIVWKHG